jgi:hypothetical protein
MLAEELLEGVDTIWDINLKVTAPLVLDDSQNWNSLGMCFRDSAGSFLGVIAIDLDKMGPGFELSLDIVGELIHRLVLLILLVLLLLTVLLLLLPTVVVWLQQLLLLLNHRESIGHNNKNIFFIINNK